ncbi:MAG: hypothetical protein HYY01_00265 [Chloroflexi bacterium]|nr:hypothetical protein [Chloroflexota bacterium]
MSFWDRILGRKETEVKASVIPEVKESDLARAEAEALDHAKRTRLAPVMSDAIWRTDSNKFDKDKNCYIIMLRCQWTDKLDKKKTGEDKWECRLGRDLQVIKGYPNRVA